MNILFIHEVDLLEKVVFEIHSVAEILSVFGHKVYALDYENKWKPSGSLIATKRVFENVSRAVPHSSVCLIRPGFVKIPGISRLSAFFTHYAEIEKLLRTKQIDAMVLYSVPTNGVQTIHLAKKYGIPVVFRSFDILSKLVPNSFLGPVTSLLENHVYSRVDLILTINDMMSKYVIGKGAAPDRVKIVPLGVDLSVFNPSVDAAPQRTRWGISEDDQVILYIGTFFNFCGLDEIIRRFGEVLTIVPGARLLLVGDGPLRPKLDKMILELGLSGQVTITGFQPFESMPQFINLSAICVNPFAIMDATRDIIPGKLFQYLACGKPVVSSALPGIVSTLPERVSGVLFASDAEDIIQKIVFLLKSPKERHKLGADSLAYARLNHDYTRVGRDFEMAVQKLVSKRNGVAARQLY